MPQAPLLRRVVKCKPGRAAPTGCVWLMHPAESNAIASYERALWSCATAALLIDHSRRKYELSRERLRASGDALLALSEWVPRRITFIPSRIPISRVRYVLLFIRGGVQVEACPCGQEY